MSKFEKWKKKVKENSINDPEIVEQYIRSMVQEGGKPHRLEGLYDSSEGLLLLQGNLQGLAELRDTLTRLINTGKIGGHAHYDERVGFSKANISMIVQLVGDNDEQDGSHVINDD